MPEYKAVKDGVLSDPYRFVKKGEVIDLDESVKASWLVPSNTPDDPKRPIVPYLKSANNKRLPPSAKKIAGDDSRQEHIKTMKKASDDKALKDKKDESKGTGNKDVL